MLEIFDVICIGAALVDMMAKVDRHPGEDDEVFVSDLKLFSGGAAANTAYACAKLGLKAAFMGKLGFNDAFGAKIISDFREVNVNTSLIKYSLEQGTGSTYIVLNKKGDRRIYAHSGAANYLEKEEIIKEELIRTKIIYLSSLKNLNPFIKASRIGKENGIPVILNPGMLIIDQGFNNIKILLENIDVLILSQREYRTLLKIQENKITLEIAKKKANNFWELGVKILVITMGSNGALLLDENNSEILPAVKDLKVIDTTGAGDAFSAGFIYGFCQNLSYRFNDLKNDAKMGNIIAGYKIQELGARSGVPNREELNNFLFKYQ